tara:strand:- start:11481 stop:12725 length:1245 start_codon:yes stop_codon:yes gene_type:complete
MKTSNEIKIEDWFDKIDKKEITPSILFYVGEMGTGKKTKLRTITEKYNYTISNLNWLHQKNHSIIKKKNFVADLKHIVSNRNIEYFLTGSRDIVFIHNTHIINDKSLFDEILKLNTYIDEFITPVVFIINQSFVSERLLTHMTRTFYLSYHENLSKPELTNIVWNKVKTLNPNIYDEVEKIVNDGGSNIYSLTTTSRQYAISGEYSTTQYNSKKVDKNIVLKCFEDLCSSEKWNYKYKFVKPHESLMRLLMPNHISRGLDCQENISLSEKLDIAKKSIQSLNDSEILNCKHITNFLSLLQCIYPTQLVNTVTIKTMILSNCQSTTTNSFLEQAFHPHTNDEYSFILKYLAVSIEQEQQRVKNVDNTDWNTLIPNLSKSTLNELQQLHLKIFKEHNITKKMINRFVSRKSSIIGK